MQPDTGAMVQPDTEVDAILIAELIHRIGESNFRNWFQGRTTLTAKDDQLLIGVGSPFMQSWMQKQFREPLTKVAQIALGPSASLCFEVTATAVVASATSGQESAGNPHQPGIVVKPSAIVLGERRSGSPSSAKVRPAGKTTANRRRYAKLSEFVSGDGSDLALAAARQISTEPGMHYNPLYLFGPVGVGKTHLLEGIYSEIRSNFPALQVMHLTSEAFANYFTQALREHTLPSFRQRFRNVDVLLVDDIDFLNGKRAIQEEFLHTFKQLESHGRQIVLSADCHPRLLTKLSEELTTRFVSGMICRIETPDFETRKRIAVQKSRKMDAELTPEVLTFIAQRFKNNVRELEGALNCLQTYYTMTKKRIGVTAARRLLADLERDCIRIVRLSDVERVVCDLFGVDPADLKSSRRNRTLSQPRMLAMFLSRKHTQAAYSEIGDYFGGRNHSTAISAERAVKGWLKKGDAIRIASQEWTLDEVMETLEQQLMAS